MADLDLRPLVVTNNYPTTLRPNEGTFVESLVAAWWRQGVKAAVVAPVPFVSGKTRRPVFSYPDSVGGSGPPVLRAVYPSFSSFSLGPLSGRAMTLRAFTRAAQRAARRAPFPPSLVYGHFLSPSGLAAATVAEELGIPAVVAMGESSDLLSSYADWMGRDGAVAAMRRFAGILSVSAATRQQLIDDFAVPADAIEVVPNAVDPERFHPHDREATRRKLGLPVDRTILAFLGSFDDRKGVMRVLAALERHPGAAGVFIGDGPLVPAGPPVLFADRVRHADVPLWLSAADFLVLPTRFEGSPNAVIEAMACGLPVIASDIPALVETVPPEAAILVDADDVDAIARAIGSLIEDPGLRERMGAAALAHAGRHGLADRAERIAGWLGRIQREHSPASG